MDHNSNVLWFNESAKHSAKSSPLLWIRSFDIEIGKVIRDLHNITQPVTDKIPLYQWGAEFA